MLQKGCETTRTKQDGPTSKEKELADQKWVFEQFLQSPTWRFTAPIRWVGG